MRISDWSSDVCSSDIPVVLAHAILDGDDRVFITPAGEEIDELLAGQALALADQVVLAVLVELGARHVQAQQHVLAGVVAGLADGFEDGVERLDVRSEEHTSELQSLLRISNAVF